MKKLIAVAVLAAASFGAQAGTFQLAISCEDGIGGVVMATDAGEFGIYVAGKSYWHKQNPVELPGEKPGEEVMKVYSAHDDNGNEAGIAYTESDFANRQVALITPGKTRQCAIISATEIPINLHMTKQGPSA